MRRNQTLYDYHEWLISLVDSPSHDLAVYYSDLMMYLDDVSYESPNKLDQSRIQDAYDQREYYDQTHSTNVSRLLFDVKPSILEVFTALLVRYSDEVLVDPGAESMAPELFHDILRNIGALEVENRYFSVEKGDSFCDSFLKKRVFLVENERKMPLYMALGKFCMGEFV